MCNPLYYYCISLFSLRSTIRALNKNFSIAFFFPAFITLLFFQHNRTVYDIVAGTIVVKRNRLRWCVCVCVDRIYQLRKQLHITKHCAKELLGHRRERKWGNPPSTELLDIKYFFLQVLRWSVWKIRCSEWFFFFFDVWHVQCEVNF